MEGVSTMPTDEKIKKDVTDHLYWDYRVDASEVQIEVDDGIVVLDGTVPSFVAMESAADDAWSVRGVMGVENDLEVRYEPSIDIPTDDEIRSNIQKIFLWNPHLTAYKIDVEVEDGWVTLEGTVDAFWKKIRSELEAKDVIGVLGVTNKLSVVPTESITDESIAENVVDAIDRDVRVRVEDINVEVEMGEVTLTGNVPSWSAKTAAYSSALYTNGVIDVVDKLIVNP
jgi:osmotically-inducible protein OsmY